mgnify:CR=1 FL=1
MHVLKIALLQISPCGSLDENLEKGIQACQKAKERGADIALFPEMWSNGYRIYDRPAKEWKVEAISSTAVLSTHSEALPGSWIWRSEFHASGSGTDPCSECLPYGD